MAFADEDDLAAEMHVTAVNSDYAERVLDKATVRIKEYVGWSVEEETTTYTDSGGARSIFLPTLRLTAIASVVEYGATLVADTDYFWTPDGHLLRYPRPWYAYPNAIVVTYTHGYSANEVPGIFKEVCLAMASRAYLNPGQSRSQSVGGIAEEFVVSDGGYSWGASLMPSEKQDLERYRLPAVA